MMAILTVRDENGREVPIPALQGKSAYQYAKDGGYTGTEKEFADKLASEWNTATEVENKAEAIVETVSGESITVSDSAEAKLRNLAVFGKSEQNSTTGKNLWNSDSDFEFTATTTYKALTISGWNFGEGERKYLCNVYGFTPSRLVLWAYDADGVLIMNHATPFTRNLTQEQADSIVTVRLVMEGTMADTTYSGRFEIMATTDLTVKEYEPYTGGIASPNPEYPQEIRSVGGDGNVEVGVYGKNLAKFANEANKNRKTYDYTSEVPNRIEATKNIDGGNFFARFEAELKKGVTYTISAKEDVITYIYEDELWGSAIGGGRVLPETFTVEKDGRYVFGAYNDKAANTIVTLTDFQRC